MRLNLKKTLAMGLLGLSLAGIGSAVFWMHGRHDTSRGFDALNVPIKDLKGGKSDLERRFAKMNDELASLRSQLAQLSQDQGSIAPPVDQTAYAELENSEAPASDEEGAAAGLSPEEEIERADAQMQAQIELIEETILAEEDDPEWSSWAEFAMEGAYGSEEMEGLKLMDAECRTTVCRLELSLDGDGSASPEAIFHNLVDFAPWQGEVFFRVDDGAEGESAHVVVYLARDGYSLPQYRE